MMKWLMMGWGCILLNVSFAQNFTIKIALQDSTSQPLSRASIEAKQFKGITDSLGNWEQLVPGGQYQITVSSIGFSSKKINLYLQQDTTLYLQLQPNYSTLQEAVVTASNREISKVQMSAHKLDIDFIKKLPVVFGEVDVLKTITLLPGIKSGGDGNAGIYVRGGGPDQNLVLLDGVPVYNPNHLLGFFSIFNSEAVENIEAIKGGIPAEYGGRLSSVINVTSKNTFADSLSVSGGIGLISSKIGIQGPLFNKKASFNVSVRRTYADALARAVAKSQIGDNGYYFYDVNASFNYKVNDNHQLGITLYGGNDQFSFRNQRQIANQKFTTEWGNTIAGLTLKSRLSNRLTQQLAASYNQFALDSRFGFSTLSFQFSSGIRDYSLKGDWQYKLKPNLTLKWGGQQIWHRFSPGAGGLIAGNQEFANLIDDLFAREMAGYVATDYEPTSRIAINAGLRYSSFSQVGPTTIQVFDREGTPVGEPDVFAKGNTIASFQNPEPRLAIRYKFDGNQSLKLSYTRTAQYIHLATTSSASFPSDVWLPSSRRVMPAIADQIAAGFFKASPNNMFEYSLEAYYKTMSNQIEFRPGAQLILNQSLENEMIFGTGVAYGVEMLLQKKRGRLTGWLGYTLSRTERTFAQLNNGNPFPYRYDRTHDLSLVANYTINPKWTASFIFTYNTGNALTLPNGRFTYLVGVDAEEQEPIFTNIDLYDKINDYRLPAYHRADINFTYTPKPFKTKGLKSSWSFGIFNVYNRANPFFIYLDTDRETNSVFANQVYILPIIPSVTWNFKW